MVTAEGFESTSLVLDFIGGEARTTPVILYRPGPGPLSTTGSFLADHWVTLALVTGVVVALLLLGLGTLDTLPESSASRLRRP